MYPGSFDPITNGHLDIVNRSIKLFDEIVILVAANMRKGGSWFPVEERIALIKEAVGNNPKIKVESWDGLIMDYASKNNVNVVIRGLRAVSDFEYEFLMAAANKRLNDNVETMFMMTGESLFFVSSSLVKELHKYGSDISHYVPLNVKNKILEKGTKI